MQRQRLTRAISATASSTGEATFTLEYVPTSLYWTVTLNIPSAPASAESTAVASGSTYGQWRGSNSWGPLLVGNGEQLVVTTSGLLPGEQYVLQAVGFSQTEGTPDYTYPLAYADTVTTSIEDLFIGSIAGVTAYTISVPISPAWRSLWVAVSWANAATDTISATGDQSSIELQSFQPPYFKNAKDTFYRYPLIAGLDTSVTLELTSSADFSAWWGADLSDIDIATYSTIAEVLGLTFESASTGVTYSTYSGIEGDGYTFTNVPNGAATVDVTIATIPPPPAWTSSTLPAAEYWQVAISGTNAVAVQNISPTSSAAAYSTDGGQTWTASTLPAWTDWQVALSGTNAVAVESGTSGTAAAYSTNGGQTWTASTLPASAKWQVALSGTTAVAVESGASSNIAAYSTNGGQTWTSLTLPASALWQVALSSTTAVAVTQGGTAAATMAIEPPLPFTLSCIGQTSLTTYSTQTITTPGTQTLPFTVVPAIDSTYYLVSLPTDGTYWNIPATTGDIVSLASYVSNTAPSPLTNIISITYTIFTPMPGVDLSITDALGNVVGTISLGTSAGTYTAHLAYASPNGTTLIASAPEANAYWKIYTWVASN